MFKNYLKLLYFIVLFIVIQSCANDDNNDSYVAIIIETSSDLVEVSQNSSIEIDVLSNDTNVPTLGNLTVNNATNGTVEVLDLNNTPNNPSDDTVLYTPSTDFVGTDSFSYTICNNLEPISCSTETVTITVNPVTPVVFNLDEIPYNTLSEYHFFEGELKNLEPAFGVVPYDLNSTLFTDYALKKRFVWMPNNSKASYNTDGTPLNFPIGSVLIKNFYYDNVQPTNTTRIIETRLMYMTEEGWDFAKYVWNESQTEATFTNNGSFINIDWVEEGITNSVNYRIPSRNECFTCHNKFGTPLPIGPKPQNLNKTYNYPDGISNQLSKWIEVGYLENNLPTSIVSTVKWSDESLPLELRVRSYLDINCAHCHSEESYCEYRPLRLAFNENEDDVNKGVCVTPDTQIAPYTHIIASGEIDKSLLHFRISSTEEQYRMPLLGRTLQHSEGVRLIEEWINSLEGICE
ncbi:Ig-like domain-containing protein [uncultured Psychroserpens sp.]|uniref:Ig-like domain-containing protein n=1 Tax=uncultured Psychroserpens sp. TaxID=255436 RepID=UPI00263A3BE9|nr:Ig-like domain-containing protein [uncultured Psychroserpens sp.]